MAFDQPIPSRSRVQVKTPKGTRDWAGQELLIRDQIFATASDVFRRHGGIPLDTPVFELTEILAGKYGEDSKLIYDLKDQGGELCSLRYDLTVPFARWLAMNTNAKQVKRYHIGKVYRRDQPAMSRGRLREFYQCDFDIAGVYDSMIPDAEILRIGIEVLSGLGMEVKIKLNHRRILDGSFEVAGVQPDQIRAISSAVDKLDKAAWSEVKKEMVEDKGLPEGVADRVGRFVQRNGSLREMLDILKGDEELIGNENIKAGLADMTLLMGYLEAMKVADKVSFDLSLARGLDYYTGLIYEIVPVTENGLHVGSIAAGGRYDGLVGMYTKQAIPCVGLSFGVDRIFTLLNAQRDKEGSNLSRKQEVYIIGLGGGKDFDGLLLQRMAVASDLWDAGIQAEFLPKVKPKSMQQFNASKDAPICVILGEDELAAGQVRLKVIHAGDSEAAEKDRGRLVDRAILVEEVQKILASISK